MRASWRAPASATRPCKALTDFADAIAAAPGGAGAARRHPRRQGDRPGRGTAEEGVAEALYGLGSAIGTDGGPELPVAYLQLALYLEPVALSRRHGDRRRHAGGVALRRGDRRLRARAGDAGAAPQRRPADRRLPAGPRASPTRRCAMSSACSTRRSDDIEAAVMLGNIYRGDRQVRRGGRRLQPRHRGDQDGNRRRLAHLLFPRRRLERSKQWPQAEADFKHALKLSPGQPRCSTISAIRGWTWASTSTRRWR